MNEKINVKVYFSLNKILINLVSLKNHVTRLPRIL